MSDVDNGEHVAVDSDTGDTGAVCRLDGGEGADQDPDRSHLEGVDDGCGCTEIWEHLSEQRDG